MVIEIIVVFIFFFKLKKRYLVLMCFQELMNARMKKHVMYWQLMILKHVKQSYFEHTSVNDQVLKFYIRKSRKFAINIKLQHDTVPDVVIKGVGGGDDVVQMGDVFAIISCDVLEADVGESDCFLHVI